MAQYRAEHGLGVSTQWTPEEFFAVYWRVDKWGRFRGYFIRTNPPPATPPVKNRIRSAIGLTRVMKK